MECEITGSDAMRILMMLERHDDDAAHVSRGSMAWYLKGVGFGRIYFVVVDIF